MNFPRILIINGEPFQDISATGITLKNIFNGIPAENISFVHFSSMTPDLDYVDNVYSYLNDNVQNKKTVNLIPKTNPAFQVRSNLNNALRKEINLWLDLYFFQTTDSLNQYIIDSKATIIYSCLGNFKINRLVLHAQKLLGCKIVIHFMDDWKSQIYKNKRFYFHRILLRKHLQLIFKKSKEGIAISQGLATKYQDQYDLPFYSIMNSVPDNLIKEYISTNQRPTNFVFTGGLHLNRWESLITICKAINLLGNKDVSFNIYCPLKDRVKYEIYFKNFSFVNFKGHVSVKDLAKVFEKSDILVHCESFNRKIAEYTKYSISTKIPEYMKEAKLILAYGPSYIESINYLKRNNAGVALSETDPSLLALEIRSQIFDQKDNGEKIINATKLVKQNHSYSSVEAKLRKIFV